jgi:hypothetical protein
MTEGEELDINSIELAEYIFQNISEELSGRVSLNVIILLLDMETDYIDKEYEINKNRIPYISFDLRVLDQREINKYVWEKANQQGLDLTLEDVDEIMYAELDYLNGTGLIGSTIIEFN